MDGGVAGRVGDDESGPSVESSAKAQPEAASTLPNGAVSESDEASAGPASLRPTGKTQTPVDTTATESGQTNRWKKGKQALAAPQEGALSESEKPTMAGE